MTDEIDVEGIASRAIQLLGGPGELDKIANAALAEEQRRWNQDVERIGRILRSHLYVEHYLAESLAKANPRLGSLEAARLSFTQKLALLSPGNVVLKDLLPGIKHLNTIRNRLAHRLSSTVTQADGAVFLEAKIFKAMREIRAVRNEAKLSEEPLEILEEFARFVGIILVGEFDPVAQALAKALEEARSSFPKVE